MEIPARGGDLHHEPRENAGVTTVLVVEDERDIRDVLRRYLERAGLNVVTTGTGAEAIQLLTSADLNVVILDLGLPDIDGLEVLREARRLGGLRVLVLTARSQVDDRIVGLEAGADDYVTKPFSPREVVLRVQAIIDRTATAGRDREHSFGTGRLCIDDERHEATLDGRLLELTPSEWGILSALTGHPGRVYSRYELVNRVRGYEFSGYERSIDSHVKNLRHKLHPEGSTIIETVTGVGYRFGWSRDD